MKGFFKSTDSILRFSMIVVIIAGIAFMAVAYFGHLRFEDIKANGIKTTASITRISFSSSSSEGDEYDVYVTYEIEGQRFENVRLNAYSSSMYVGKEITIYCMPGNLGRPEYIENSGIFTVVFGLAGLALFAGGTITLVIAFVKDGQSKRLRENGKSVELTICELRQNTSISVNSVHPIQVICQDQLGNIFKSKNIYKHSHLFQVGDPITVYIDSEDERKYYVDIDTYIKVKQSRFEGFEGLA